MAKNKKQMIQGLYFPYANIRTANALKTAAMYFDTISILHPRAAYCGRNVDPKQLYNDPREHREEMAILVKEGIINLVDPSDVIKKHGNDIMTGIIQDMYDKTFLKACSPHAHQPWILSSTKLPHDADRWLRNIIVNVPTLALDGSPISKKHRHRDLMRLAEMGQMGPYFEERMPRFREHHFEEIRPRKRYYEEKRPGRYDEEYESRLLREAVFEEDRVAELPFTVGESLMIGHAMAIAADGHLTPFCDEPVHLEAWKIKSANYANNKVVKAILQEYGYVKDTKADILAQEVLNELVPSLEAVPLDAILDFRKKRRKELEVFRQKMQSLLSEIEETPWDKRFAKRVRDIVDKEVKPSLQQIEYQLLNCKDAFWKDAVEKVSKVGPLPVVASLFTGVPTHVAVALGASLAGLTVILDQWAKRKKIKRNGWAFLIDCQRLSLRKKRR